MIISICGDNKYKNILINKFKEKYKDAVVECDYFHIKFNSVINTEKYKYELLDSSSSLEKARLEYSNVVDNTVKERINNFLEVNKDKIIILISDEILNPCFYDTEYFMNSDIKILAVNENIDDINYDKSLFDYVYNDISCIDVRKLVRK